MQRGRKPRLVPRVRILVLARAPLPCTGLHVSTPCRHALLFDHDHPLPSPTPSAASYPQMLIRGCKACAAATAWLWVCGALSVEQAPTCSQARLPTPNPAQAAGAQDCCPANHICLQCAFRASPPASSYFGPSHPRPAVQQTGKDSLAALVTFSCCVSWQASGPAGRSPRYAGQGTPAGWLTCSRLLSAQQR